MDIPFKIQAQSMSTLSYAAAVQKLKKGTKRLPSKTELCRKCSRP